MPGQTSRSLKGLLDAWNRPPDDWVATAGIADEMARRLRNVDAHVERVWSRGGHPDGIFGGHVLVGAAEIRRILDGEEP